MKGNHSGTQPQSRTSARILSPCCCIRTSKAKSSSEIKAAIFLPLRVMSTGSIPYAARLMTYERLRRSSAVLISGMILGAMLHRDGRQMLSTCTCAASGMTYANL